MKLKEKFERKFCRTFKENLGDKQIKFRNFRENLRKFEENIEGI